MKYFLSCIFTLALLIPVYTQAQTSCEPVTAQSYSFCCETTAGAATNASSCRLFNTYGTAGASTQSVPPTTTSAPATTNDPTRQCDTIYSFNKSYCCGTFRSQNQLKCDEYDLKNNTFGTTGSGSTVRNTTTSGASSTIGAVPVSGSAELRQCSKITFKSFLDILIWIKCIINVVIIPMLFALATLFFLWGVLQFIRTSDSTKRKEAQKTIWAGLIGLFVMVSLWGIIAILGTTLGTGSTVPLLQTTYLK